MSVGWSGYVVGLIEHAFSIDIPDLLVRGPYDGGLVNLPAMLIALLVATLALLGLGRTVYGAMGGRGAALDAALAYSDTLFGGATTKSKKMRRFATVSLLPSSRTVFIRRPNFSPVAGFLPSHNARNSASFTLPLRPSFFAPSPSHSPATFMP